jgi:hypothetical protein
MTLILGKICKMPPSATEVFANEEKSSLTEGHLTYKRTPDETHPLFMEMIKENRHLYHRDSNLEN